MGDPRENSDVALLLDLLTLLPKPDAYEGFWADFAIARGGWDLSSYVINVGTLLRKLEQGEGGASEIWDLSSYCLMFFDVDSLESDPASLELLDKNVRTDYIIWHTGSKGRRWARSICEVAWRLFVPLQAERQRSYRRAT